METFQRPELKLRDPADRDTDKAALQAIAQAAVDVELFTLPLYMVSMYSIQGMHQITSKDNDFYRGRLWPGAAPSRTPDASANAAAFNHFFSVFIDEMLHLQLASNIAKALGVMPSFNSPALQDDKFGWVCYGPDVTLLPHILDFNDAVDEYKDIRVKLDALTPEQNRLFLAIEENEADAKKVIAEQNQGKYFPTVPFENWQPGDPLPLFGSIGAMYKCLWQYVEMEYTDGVGLFEYVFNRGTLERDLFNAASSYHKPEYPNMPTLASGEISVPDAMENVLTMINAITDQGEGQGVADEIRRARARMLRYAPVGGQFRPDPEALDFDYPNYNDQGQQNNPSGQKVARTENGALDHHDRFLKIDELLRAGSVVTWDRWHAEGNKWTAATLITNEEDYKENTEKWKNLPPADAIAAALNNLKNDPDGDNYKVFSQAAAGSIAGITRILSGFWTNETTGFPFPSMYGSGDRVSICWAVFGRYPDLTGGIAPKQPGQLYHACQGLELGGASTDACAQVEVFHSCRGSNSCKAEGGCGFVQIQGHSQLCGHKVAVEHLQPTLQVQASGLLYSAPSDNMCASFGGCAVPISASQLYPPPKPGEVVGWMEVFDFVGQTATPVKIPKVLQRYEVGDRVYDIAWEAYLKVLAHRQQPAPDKPKDSDLRLAFPPST
ncbi:MAG TPA: ferritin-like domain-containing protein [Pyrinomonadaceae bacterium]|nr:ferritin-like domain-containing protein [Pyrinomonadaceae bacterium]